MLNRSADEYATLMASLPSSSGLFKAKVPPLSRIKLDRRLAMLTPLHRYLLQQVEQILDWRLMDANIDHHELIQRRKKLFEQIQQPTLQRLIQERLEIRTFIFALRLREKGHQAPVNRDWAFGRWQQHIVRHWHEPAFQLQRIFTWALQAESLYQNKRPFELEKLLLEVSYKQLQRHAGQHQFDFEAVVIYVMKWNIINRSTQYNSHVASKRFGRLLERHAPKADRLLNEYTTMETGHV